MPRDRDHEVCDFLETLQLEVSVVERFRREAVDGRVLCEVSDEDLSGCGRVATGRVFWERGVSRFD